MGRTQVEITRFVPSGTILNVLSKISGKNQFPIGVNQLSWILQASEGIERCIRESEESGKNSIFLD